MHDAFVRAVRHRRSLRDEAAAAGWIARIVINEARRARPHDSPHGREIYSSLLTGYRDAVRSGTARVLADGWINIAPGHDVQVSQDTYRPVAMRVGGHVTRILEYRTIVAVPQTIHR